MLKKGKKKKQQLIRRLEPTSVKLFYLTILTIREITYHLPCTSAIYMALPHAMEPRNQNNMNMIDKYNMFKIESTTWRILHAKESRHVNMDNPPLPLGQVQGKALFR